MGGLFHPRDYPTDRNPIVAVDVGTQAGGWDIKVTSSNNRCNFTVFTLDRSLANLKEYLRKLIRAHFQYHYSLSTREHRIVWKGLK